MTKLVKGKQIQWAPNDVIKGPASVSIASASTVDLSTAASNTIIISGNTTINSFGTVDTGTLYHVTFTGTPLLTYNATSLKLPTSANIQTAANDSMVLKSLGSGNWEVMIYQKKDGTPLVGAADPTKLPLAGGIMTGLTRGSSTFTIASASTTDLNTATSNQIVITGTTTITGFGTVESGTIFFIRFNGALTLTHNATTFALPTAANITTVLNDCAIFRSMGSGNWGCISYQRADGTALVSAAGTYATYNAQPANPTGTTSTTGVMMGLAGSITPSKSGKVFISVSGLLKTTQDYPVGVKARLRTGTGAAPTNGAALTGTIRTALKNMVGNSTTTPMQSNDCTLSAVITGLSVGTAYWIDVELVSTAGTSTASIFDIDISAFEIP